MYIYSPSLQKMIRQLDIFLRESLARSDRSDDWPRRLFTSFNNSWKRSGFDPRAIIHDGQVQIVIRVFRRRG